MQSISNIYRAAAAVRRRAEREVLAKASLSWGGFALFEGKMSEGLSVAEEHELARLLRAVTTNASE